MAFVVVEVVQVDVVVDAFYVFVFVVDVLLVVEADLIFQFPPPLPPAYTVVGFVKTCYSQ